MYFLIYTIKIPHGVV